MEKNPTQGGHLGLQYGMRAIHRVLGYLAVGMMMSYALSGIILILRTTDFMKHTVECNETLAPGLSADELDAALHLRGFEVVEETPEIIVFTTGSYDKATGIADYTKKEVVEPFNRMMSLHMVSEKKAPVIAWITVCFGAILFLLALTSLFMYRPVGPRFRANMLYTAVGLALTIILVVIIG